VTAISTNNVRAVGAQIEQMHLLAGYEAQEAVVHSNVIASGPLDNNLIKER
jgi:hypothetical protein